MEKIHGLLVHCTSHIFMRGRCSIAPNLRFFLAPFKKAQICHFQVQNLRIRVSAHPHPSVPDTKKRSVASIGHYCIAIPLIIVHFCIVRIVNIVNNREPDSGKQGAGGVVVGGGVAGGVPFPSRVFRLFGIRQKPGRASFKTDS